MISKSPKQIKNRRTNTTLAGRVLVIKSLALSKLVHFFIALPTPPKEFMRNINTKFYYFPWRASLQKLRVKQWN